MSNSIQPAQPDEILSTDDLSSLSIDDLRRELASALTITASGLMRAAAIWSELTRRGESLTELRSGLAIWLPRIARGDLAAEAVIAFAGQRMLLQRLVGMPLSQQRQFARGDTIPVASENERGELVGEDKPLARLTSREIMMALGDDGTLRPLTAQIKSLSQRTRVRKFHSPNSTAQIRADKAAGLLVVGRARVEPEALAAALRTLGWKMERM